ncbi:hypothetical protein JZ751_010450, partial [Albula glossodonta]
SIPGAFFLRIYYLQVISSHSEQKNPQFLGVRFFRLFSGPRLTFFSVLASTDSLRFLPFNPFLVPFFVSTICRLFPAILSRKIHNSWGSDFSDFFQVRGLRFFRFWPQLIPCVFSHLIHSWLFPAILSRKIHNSWGSDFSDFFQVRGLRFFRFWPQLIPCVFSHLIHSWCLFSSYLLSAGPGLTFFSVLAST